jgi:hypothetical protein
MLLPYGIEDYVVRISFFRATGVIDFQYLFSALEMGIASLLIRMIVDVPHRIYSCFCDHIKKERNKEGRKEREKERKKKERTRAMNKRAKADED